MHEEELARAFHETYERLAPEFGYETRTDTKEFDAESPNGRLMIAVCGEVNRMCEKDSSSERERLIEENDLGWETVRLQAKEINRLRNESTTYEIPANIRVLREMHDETVKELRDEMELLEAECDGYRRQICRLESVRPEGGWGDATSGTTPEAIAKKYGWDCYEKEE